MISISDIPHPSWTELLVSTEVFVFLYIPKRMIDNAVRREEKFLKDHTLVFKKRHRKYHTGRFADCTHCSAMTASLQTEPLFESEHLVS